MRKLLSLIFFLITLFLYSQEPILAVKEQISTFKLGGFNTYLQYNSSEEGLFSPNGPFIDGKGVLFFYPTYNREYLIEYNDGTLRRIDLLPNRNDFEKLISTSYIFTSQQGTITVPGNGLTFNYYSNMFRAKIFDWGDGKIRAFDYILIPVPNGMVLNSKSEQITICAEFISDGSIRIKNLHEIRTWLPTQPGGFTIGIDGLLYRNGILWSEKKAEGIAGDYIGKLMSGHNIYQSGRRFFRITNSTGALELELEIPWAEILGSGKGFNLYDYGLGPWGELYCLIAPFWDYTDAPWPPENSESELVVVRNHLSYFGRLNIDAVRLRKEPNTTSEILGTYPAKTGFRILEKGTIEETIGGQKNVWYKVRLLDGKEGYFFGAFVHNLYDGPNGLPPPWPNVPDW